ncbi:class I SAM-dependent rRNA methyltransferase [Nitrospirillum iridis]|uniref:23S rRNA (Cytosine1962-C5)-methyltransferase n=1 Tax=Nitrospirillum iridis TaxID=765888 RepID=A0A7X0AYL7_9PROT|nr:class I SAM-dependent rRNA methyltransferase [Nitrospirillum iridis]MBB6252543.1 23S rRNA (cytosine1962-C5)-methyltransferase [Nitrospirillum iridis]
MTDKLPTLLFQAGRHKRVAGGHPWAYSNEIQMDAAAKALPKGGLVRLADAGGGVLGIATFNPHTLIAARVLTRDLSVTVDAGFFAERFRAAANLRDRLIGRPYYRLVHAEADGLPALIVDRYGDVLVVQANSAGMDRLLPQILEGLAAVFPGAAVILRNDSAARGLEGVEEEVRVAVGTVDGPLQLEENGATFFADPAGGQKTGWFYDQRDNRAFVANLAKGRSVIDFYSYCGGFGVLAATRGAARTVLVDRSAGALELAGKAAAANGVADRVELRKADAFAELERLAEAGETFEVVICDPPAFVKSKKDLANGTRAYAKLAKLGAQITAPGGILLVASCSHNMPADLFAEQVAKGLKDARRQGRILRFAGAGPDHPVHPLLPESAYLKAEVLALD